MFFGFASQETFATIKDSSIFSYQHIILWSQYSYTYRSYYEEQIMHMNVNDR